MKDNKIFEEYKKVFRIETENGIIEITGNEFAILDICSNIYQCTNAAWIRWNDLHKEDRCEMANEIQQMVYEIMQRIRK